MRRLSWFLDRAIPWLAWWQELILNWVASWACVGSLVVVAPDGETIAEWSLPSDLRLKRQELEQLLER